MKHGILFFSLLVLLTGAAGGVFVLVHEGGVEQEIAKEALIASVAIPEESVEGMEAGPPQYSKAQAAPTPAPKPKAIPPAPVSTQTSSPSLSPIVPPATEPTPSLTPTSTPPPPGGSAPLPPPPSPDPAPQPSPVPASAPSEKININTANLEELEQITGVGPAIAQHIIDYRQNVSLFYQIEDLKNVDGIGEVNFEKMKDEITVGNVLMPSTPPPVPAPQPPPSTPEKININTASYEELQQITGVGAVIAQRIIDYRSVNGPFQQIEDLKNVSGIGDKTFEKMRDEITI